MNEKTDEEIREAVHAFFRHIAAVGREIERIVTQFKSHCHAAALKACQQEIRQEGDKESGETHCTYSCEFNHNIKEDQLRWGEEIRYRRIGDPEWTITENRDNVRSPQNPSQQQAARAGSRQARNRANPTVRESVETWKL